MTLTPAGIADTDDDPLAPEPANLTGALIGYARVSTSGQILDRQTRALTEAGCLRVFADKLSGKTAGRPELVACLDCLRAGDTLVVPGLDRLSRSLQDLITIVAGLRRRGVGFRSLHEALDTTTPGGRLVFHVFAALAEFIRELIAEGTREGLDAARARGQRLGRPPAMTAEQIRQARDLLTLPGNSISSIARLHGVSRSTIYKHLPELADGHRPAGRIPPSRAGLPARLAITAPAGRSHAGSGRDNPRRALLLGGNGMTAQPGTPGPDTGSYEVIHLGGQAAVVVPVADFLRLRTLEQAASPEELEDAEDTAAVLEWKARDAAGQTTFVSAYEARRRLGMPR
ncbi:MAG: recombinase family protein [Streptosporangiaceae bacterium]